MNHGPDFQALWKQLRLEVRQLQDKGYYGDGAYRLSLIPHKHTREGRVTRILVFWETPR